MSNSTKDNLAAFGAVVGFTLYIPLLTAWHAIWQAAAGWQIWQWFFIPLGAPDINGFHIVGLLLLIQYGLTRADSKTQENKEEKSLTEVVLMSLFVPMAQALIVVLVGALFAKLAGLI